MGFRDLILVAIVLVVQVNLARSADWDYNRNGNIGPNDWAKSSATCGGNSQSPIDIDTSSVTTSASLTALNLKNYDTNPTTLTLTNNGHAAQVNVDGSQGLSGGDLPNEYKLAQFHFHWGSTGDSDGSEHTLNGKAYPLEVHFVHYSNVYGSLGDAADKAKGLAVVGAFFEVSDSDNTNLDPIIDQLTNVKDKDATHNLSPFALNTLLPETGDYYRYSGSLTTPGCFESVIWTVLDKKISISQSQLNKFYSLKDKDGAVLVDIYRPVQDLNGRTVYASFTPSGGAATSPSIIAFSLISLISALLFQL